MIETTTFKIADTTSNPAPLGLLGFGLTTVLLNLTNAGVIPLTSVIMAMGIFVGGITQLFAGIMEWKKNNTFGAVAFTAYGAFWITLVAIWLLPKMGLSDSPDAISMGWFLTLWGLFSLGMFVGTFKLNRALQFVFGTLVLLFALLAIADFTGSHAIKVLAGYEGIVCGLSAIYTCLAQIINELYGKSLIPLGALKS